MYRQHILRMRHFPIVVNLEDFILLEVLYIGNENSSVGVPKGRHVLDVSVSKLVGILSLIIATLIQLYLDGNSVTLTH
jgi:hypothetical protein